MVLFSVGAKAGPITNQSKETEVLLTMLGEIRLANLGMQIFE